MRRLAAGCAAALAAGCAATSTAPAPPRTSTATRERTAIAALRAQWQTPTVVSPIFRDGAVDAVAVAGDAGRRDLAQPRLVLYDWLSGRWTEAAQLLLDVGGTVADAEDPAVPILLAHVTRSTEPDLVVTVHYNAGPATAVVSKVSGTWRALTYVGGVGAPGDERLAVQLEADGTLRSTENDCVPDCADGHPVVTVYHYDSASRRLVGQTKR